MPTGSLSKINMYIYFLRSSCFYSVPLLTLLRIAAIELHMGDRRQCVADVVTVSDIADRIMSLLV